ncbi:MAG: hypothetical protein KAR42_05810 [candidate division Zixibacteria bacterium]|nr:hypothetical protein [candidate division Zixibacteria bacterium]
MVDNYSIIQPPFTLKFSTMTKQEVKDYCQWYMDQIPIRLEILFNTIHASRGFEEWKPDYTPDSLNMLGEWFASQVETREETQDEIRKMYEDSPDWFKSVEIETWQLTNRTFSLAFDIGMYVSQVFLKNHEKLKWKFITSGSKRYAEYGQPVIYPFGKRDFNPTGMMYTQAYGLADETYNGGTLRKTYDIWCKMI